MSRYVDDSDYRRSEARHSSRREPRERDTRERVESTRERRTIDDRLDRDTRMSDAMDTRMDTRLDSRMDTRMDSRTDPRANTATRLDPPRSDRVMDSRSAESEGVVLVRDPYTGHVYREVRDVPSRSPYAREERDDFPSRSRTTMDTAMTRDRDPIRPEYTEYFCPGEGIEREVIQHEICKYLGQDATCRPGRNQDGRSGYWVRAYRPFTTAMEQSLREDTIKWQRERERRAKQGRSQGMARSDLQANRSKDRLGSYADMQARQENRRLYPGDMDIDEDYERPQRPRDLDPRPVASGRVAIPVTTAYPPEPGFPTSYTISSNQPGYPPGQPAYYGAEREPRTFGVPGNTTPPSAISRTTQGGYVQPPYASRTQPPVTMSIPAPYGDPRRDMMGSQTSSGYSDSRRHGGR